MNQAEIQQEIDELVRLRDANEAWIDALPDDRYGLCPCGCGKKIKFIMDDAATHENRFKENWLKQSEQAKQAKQNA